MQLVTGSWIARTRARAQVKPLHLIYSLEALERLHTYLQDVSCLTSKVLRTLCRRQMTPPQYPRTYDVPKLTALMPQILSFFPGD
jgi:hypothetical protein